MKRCIICGNIGDENSTVCNVCGGTFEEVESDHDDMLKTQDMERISRELEEMLLNQEKETKKAEKKQFDAFGAEEIKAEKEEQKAVNKEANKAAEKAEAEKVPAQNRQPRRMKSEPQIYGQNQMGDMAKSYNGQQGMVRRNLQGRPAAPQGQPVNAPQGRPMAPQGQPVNAPQGRPMAPQGQPMNGPQGQPMNGPQGQPMNGPQGRPMAPQGQPMAPQGQPMAPQGQPMAPQGQPMNPAPQTRYARSIMETARKSMKSPLFFLIALLNTIGLAGSVAAIFMKELNYAQAARLITDMGVPAQVAGYLDEFKSFMVMLDTSAVGVNLAILIPDLLFCLGLWMVFFCALGAKDTMSTAGFSFMKINVVIGMILSCVAVLAGLIVSVTLVVAAWASGTQSMIIGAISTMAVMIVVAMLVIMYFFCYFATIKTCRLSAKSGDTFGNASVYVALVHIVMALINVVGLLSGIVNAEISNIAGSIGKMGWMLLFGFWIFGYRKKMKEFVED